MPKYWKACRFIHDSRLRQHLLRAKSKAENFGLFVLYTCYFFICCLTTQWATFNCHRGNSLTHPVWITAFGLSIFSPKVSGRGRISTTNWAPSGLWWQCHDPLSHSPQIAENTLLGLTPNFYKMRKCPKNSYTLTLWWPLGLPHWMQNLWFKTLVFAHKLTWFKSFLKMGKIPQINQKVYNSIHSQPLGLNSTSINATFRFENFRSFTMSRYPWLKGLSHYSQRLQCTKYINSLALLLGSSYASKKSCWTQNLKLQTLGYL